MALEYNACDNVIQFWQSLTKSLEANLLADERGSLNCFVRGQTCWLNEMSMNGSDFHKCPQPLLLIASVFIEVTVMESG